jgi:hypothetical protein
MMRKRGRRSAAELAVAPVTEIAPRPAAPDELTDEQAAEWEAVVSRMPGGWLTREQHPLLIQYCRHIVSARRLAQLIALAEGAEGDWDLMEDRWLRLQRAQSAQTATLSSLATKMRLSPQSRYGPRAAAANAERGFEGPAPWEE